MILKPALWRCIVKRKDEVKFLRNLVSEIQSEKKELHKLLDQQQRLALQDKQLLEEYKAEITDLKALTMAHRMMMVKKKWRQTNNWNLKIAPRSHNLNLKIGGVLVNSYN